jgi:hypothetical protein
VSLSVSTNANNLLSQTLNKLATGMSVPGVSAGTVLDALVGVSAEGPSDAYNPSDGPAATYTPATPAPDPGTYTDQGVLPNYSDDGDSAG